MGPKGMKQLLKFDKSFLRAKWIDIKFFFIEKFLRATQSYRFKHSKYLILSSMAYYDGTGEFTQTWDDVDVSDQWGMWLPLGFGIVSNKNWEFDQQINRDIGEPEEPWREVVHHPCEKHVYEKFCPDNCGWTTYFFKEDFLNSNHYFIAARKHLTKLLGDKFKSKELQLKLQAVNQQFLLDDAIREAEWVKGGKKPFKIEFSDQAKDDFKKILGEEEAEDFFKEQEEKNKKIDEGEEENG